MITYSLICKSKNFNCLFKQHIQTTFSLQLAESDVLAQKGKFVPILPVGGLTVAMVTLVPLTLSAHTIVHVRGNKQCINN